jgi:hypothetical protein
VKEDKRWGYDENYFEFGLEVARDSVHFQLTPMWRRFRILPP